MFDTSIHIQEGAEPARTFGEFLVAGGELMVPIGLCSVFVLALTIERVLALRRARVWTAAAAEAMTEIAAGRHDAAKARLEGDRSFASRVLLAGLRRLRYPVADVESAMADQAQKELERLRRNVRPIVLIASVAPLLGLLGTVLHLRGIPPRRAGGGWASRRCSPPASTSRSSRRSPVLPWPSPRC